MVKVRLPTQAGAFYEANPEALRDQVEQCFLNKLGPRRVPTVSQTANRKIVGLVCPHAGYMFSGPVAAHSYYELALDGTPEVVAIFGPNHTGYGSGLALMNEGVWRTPLGDVEINSEIADQIVDQSQIVDVDATAHRMEHSIEVQLPFLQYLYGSSFTFVPVCFAMQDLNSARQVGETVANVLKGKNAVIIASSDMTHYEPHEQAAKKDRIALSAVEGLDEAGFYSAVESNNVSACGHGPIASLIVAARRLGAKEAKLLSYNTSGDVIGDRSSVVGYAALSFTKM